MPIVNSKIIYCISLIVLGAASYVWAQDVFFLGGIITDTKEHENSLALQVEAVEPLGDLFALSLSYLNEGHFSEHRRDGLAGQFWVSRDMPDGRISLAAGIGPYLYFDTVSESWTDYKNDHGVGAMTSVAANFNLGRQALLQLRSNWIVASEINTLSLFLGIGYQFNPRGQTGPLFKSSLREQTTPCNEISVLAGRTIVNSLGSELSSPLNIEYRRKLCRNIEWTVAGLYEGCNAMINRYGPVTQFWVVKDFFNDHYALGAGAGCYYAFDRKEGALHDGSIAGIISATTTYRFRSHWLVRATFSRVMTDYDRDSDVLLIGGGYMF